MIKMSDGTAYVLSSCYCRCKNSLCFKYVSGGFREYFLMCLRYESGLRMLIKLRLVVNDPVELACEVWIR